jgi:hypothetical protein
MGWTAKVAEFKSKYGKDFFLLHFIQIGSGAYPASYQMVLGPLSLGTEWPDCEADHSPAASAKIKNT